MVATLAVLDLYNLFVNYICGGSFWMAVVLIALTMFVIGGLLGRISVYSTTMICVMFIMAATLGSGYVTLNVFITFALLLGTVYSAKAYLTKE